MARTVRIDDDVYEKAAQAPGSITRAINDACRAGLNMTTNLTPVPDDQAPTAPSRKAKTATKRKTKAQSYASPNDCDHPLPRRFGKHCGKCGSHVG